MKPSMLLAPLNVIRRTNGSIEDGSVERKLSQGQSEMTDHDRGGKISHIFFFLLNAINTLNTCLCDELNQAWDPSDPMEINVVAHVSCHESIGRLCYPRKSL